MKILISFLLAFIFLFNAIGYQLAFGFLILHRENEMSEFMEEIREESLEVITVDPVVEKDFYVVNEKEIYYRGNLYDVKTKIQKNGKLIFHCEKDTEELELINHLNRIHDERKENNQKIPLSALIQKTFQNLYFQKLASSGTDIPTFQLYYPVISIQYNQPDLSLSTPPPQISVS